jgi:phospholipid/cholesterol/gamma-HCH transport system ATP-binding protein
MQELTAILEFREVTIRAGALQATGIGEATFSLGRGEMAVIMVEEGREALPLAPLAQGLLTPDAGTVYFNGEDWETAGPGKQSLMRGRIRRVFEHYGWVANLDMMENLTLAECHHTQRPLEEIKQEVCGLARRFGLGGVPEARPTRVHPMILRKLEWVRAFVGTPDLIILERPLAGAPKADAPLLLSAVGEAAKRGVAVIWICDELRVMECPELAGARHFRMEGDKMMAVEHKKGADT